MGRRLLLRVQRKTRRQLQRNQVLSLRSLLLSNVVIRRIVSLFQVRLSLSRRLSRCVEVVRICKDDRRATARNERKDEGAVKNYRRRSDGHVIRAHQMKNGDWMLQEDAGSMFHGVNNWYFQSEYESADVRGDSSPK